MAVMQTTAEASQYRPTPFPAPVAARLASSLAHLELAQEEPDHIALLGREVIRLGGSLVTEHWTERWCGMLQWEVIETAFHRLLRSTGDTVLRGTCETMLREKTARLRQHAERVAVEQMGWTVLRRTLWTARFRILFVAAVIAAWVDHRSALRAVGINRRLFTGEARTEAGRWLALRREGASPAGRRGRRSSRQLSLRRC